MTLIARTTTTDRPSSLAALLPTLAVDVVAPIAVLKLLEQAGVSPLWALAGAAAAPVLNNLRLWIGSRRIEPLGLLVVGFGVVGTVASLASGNLFYGLVKDSLLTGVFGLVFLASLAFRRPLLFYVLRPFVAGADEARIQAWDGLWQHAAFRAALRQLTLLWALVFAAEALIRLPLATSLSAESVVTISPLLGLGATALLVALTRRRLRALRGHFLRAERGGWPL